MPSDDVEPDADDELDGCSIDYVEHAVDDEIAAWLPLFPPDLDPVEQAAKWGGDPP